MIASLACMGYMYIQHDLLNLKGSAFSWETKGYVIYVIHAFVSNDNVQMLRLYNIGKRLKKTVVHVILDNVTMSINFWYMTKTIEILQQDEHSPLPK